jgi:hypothetical protein
MAFKWINKIGADSKISSGSKEFDEINRSNNSDQATSVSCGVGFINLDYSDHQRHIKANKVIEGDDRSITTIDNSIMVQLERLVHESDTIPEKDKPGFIANLKKWITDPKTWSSLVELLVKSQTGGA